MKRERSASKAKNKAKNKGGLATGMRRLGDVSGVGGIARTALDGEQAVIRGLVAKARELGVDQETIDKALAVKRTHDRLLTVASILFPWLPNPLLLRLLAGKPIDDLKAQKKRSPRAKSPRSLLSKAVDGYQALEKKVVNALYGEEMYGIFVSANPPFWRGVLGMIRDPIVLREARVPLGALGAGVALKNGEGHILGWSEWEDAERVVESVRAELTKLGFQVTEIGIFPRSANVDPGYDNLPKKDRATLVWQKAS